MEIDSTEPCQDSMHEMDEPIDIDDTDIDIEIPDIVIGDAFEESASGEQQYIPDFDIEGDVKLYKGSSLSCLQAVSLLLSWFSSSPGMSKRSLSSLLNLLHTHILPSGNVLPSSYRQAVKFSGVGRKSFRGLPQGKKWYKMSACACACAENFSLTLMCRCR